jgi:hypothetical protein
VRGLLGSNPPMPRARHALLLTAAAAVLAVPAAADARAKGPHLSWIRCYGKTCTDKTTVVRGGNIKLGGRRFKPGMRVIFKAGTSSKKRTVKSQFVGRSRLIAHVPGNARSGSVYLTAKHGVRTNKAGPIHVRAKPVRKNIPVDHGSPSGTAFDGTAMWIWNMPKTEAGNPNAIVARAQQHGIRTVFVKSGDGTNYWSQFSSSLVATLKAGGLKVCGWQYVYGSNPVGEAAVAAQAVTTGADCFVIDAESEYQGRYAQAQSYIRSLRDAVGADYPIGLSSFPYVDYHPREPYSEFLAPGGAQFNVPQVYWKTIGDSVDESLDHTYRYNRPYERPIVPVGQAYNNTTAADVFRFRQIVAAQQSAGVNWWSWEAASDSNFDAIGKPLTPFTGVPPSTDYALIARGAKNDLVRWAQEHLQSAGQAITVDGAYGSGTETAVKNFQAAKGLPVTGEIDTATWRALTGGYDPAPQTYSKRGAKVSAAGAGPKFPAPRYEIPPSGGSGH